jgi:hypothetical protein
MPRDLLHAVNLWHGTHSFTALSKEGALRIFSPWKIRQLRWGLNPRTWVPKASTLTPRPPKLLAAALCLLCLYSQWVCSVVYPYFLYPLGIVPKPVKCVNIVNIFYCLSQYISMYPCTTPYGNTRQHWVDVFVVLIFLSVICYLVHNEPVFDRVSCH